MQKPPENSTQSVRITNTSSNKPANPSPHLSSHKASSYKPSSYNLDGNSPFIFGFSSCSLTSKEQEFFKQIKPAGFILFARNIKSPKQIATLTASLRQISGKDCLIAIDQEGGRVQRLRPPFWHSSQANLEIIQNATSEASAKQAIYDKHYKIATMLGELGINMNCIPMIDILHPHSDDIIGDRAFGTSAKQVITYATEALNATINAGIHPVIKHIPGHGHATADSHKQTPSIRLTEQEQEEDFKPFRHFSTTDWQDKIHFAMTAHIIYEAFDKENIGSFSPVVIQKIIRQNIGFKGKIISDDICMLAIKEDMPYQQRATAAFNAGCDILLHCNGNLQEMEEVASSISKVA